MLQYNEANRSSVAFILPIKPTCTVNSYYEKRNKQILRILF